jgi:uncharacterized integral membrane protein
MSLGYSVKGFFRFITFLVFVGIVLLAFLFAVNNTTEVVLWIGVELPPVSVGVLVIVVFITGGLLGLMLGIGVFRQMKYIFQIRKLHSQLESLQGNSEHKKT